MKFKPFKNIEKEKVVFLDFEEHQDGNVSVIVVSEDGSKIDDGYLLRFDKDGTVKFYRSVNEDIGFKLNKDGSIVYEIN